MMTFLWLVTHLLILDLDHDLHIELGAFVDFRFDWYVASHRLNNSLSDIEAQSCAFRVDFMVVL